MNDIFKDKDILQAFYRACNEYPDKERYHALCLPSSGYSISEVANIFFREEDTIRSWVNKWIRERSVKNGLKERNEKITIFHKFPQQNL